MGKLIQDSSNSIVIRQRMEEVRIDLDESVQEIVDSVRDIGDWRTYLKAYPWVFLGTALAAGYLIVPRRSVTRQPNAEAIAEIAAQSRLLAESITQPRGNLRGIFLTMVGNFVLREVAAFASQQATKFLSARVVKSQPEEQ